MKLNHVSKGHQITDKKQIHDNIKILCAIEKKNRSTYVFNYILCIVNMIGGNWKKSCSRPVEISENLVGPSNNSRPFDGEGFDYIL